MASRPESLHHLSEVQTRDIMGGLLSDDPLAEVPMRYHILATDYDGTLAHDGKVDEPTIAMLNNFLATGRRLVLVTGRELPELLEIFPEIDLFEWVVAENGGLLYRPSTKEETPLAEAPSEAFVTALKKAQVGPISVGRVIVATWEPHHATVLDTIRDLGVEMHVIFNKGAVMVLPSGVNKATGLAAALKRMGMSAHNVIGVGDAENDHAMLRMCEVSVAVANALPAVKETADFITEGDHGRGVSQLMERVIAEDIRECDRRLKRHYLALGMDGDQEVQLAPFGRSVLICGPSAVGKSTVATRIVESLQERKYQFCLIDPEGDYGGLEGAVVFGGPQFAPQEEEILRLLEDPAANAVVCMTGMPISDRPAFFLKLFSQLLQLRSRTGRPHWLILDEAHHLMPADWLPSEGTLPKELSSILLITVHPDLLSDTLLDRINTVLALGSDASDRLAGFAHSVGVDIPPHVVEPMETGEFMMWLRDEERAPFKVVAHPCKMERLRHSRKYAAGELPPDRSFYFRGPGKKLNIRAQNLMLFLQIADGLDDATWQYHLRAGDYSRWFRDCIKDENLAAQAEHVESQRSLSAKETRGLIRSIVERDYTLPAPSPLNVPGAS